jgi:glycosyltransferase involved in cell wall biosynthesis
MILFVQPFGLGSPGGGSRIFRALLENAPVEWLSVAATPNPTPATPFGEEIHAQGRPYFGRLERTRFSHWFQNLDGWAGLRLESKLNQIIKQHHATAIHGIAHGCWDTLAALKSAKRNKLPFFLTVHDDPAYCLKDHPHRERLLAAIPECWREAAARFVISEEMGQELCRRWGKKDYLLVTDGLTDIAREPRPKHPGRLSVYFMGLMHIAYEPNFVALQKALHKISEAEPGLKVSLTLRCGGIRPAAVVHPELLRVLPFGSELEVQADMEEADLLYQPLSLSAAHQAMNAYSLSTKMITYLGSGLPVLFHGPASSAAGKLLARHRAAFLCHSNVPGEMPQALAHVAGPERDQVVWAALKLAAEQFRISDVRERFWNAIKRN